jgi:hypothetical protein
VRDCFTGLRRIVSILGSSSASHAGLAFLNETSALRSLPSRLASIHTIQLSKRAEFVAFALAARIAVLAHIDPRSGTLLQVCDICDERMLRAESAEGQAFVVLMEAAHRDWLSLQTE